ncbi:MAG: Sensor histidine kinase desK [Bacteroidota bacterium]|jgi:signal transduction histidine kinase
MLRIFPDLNPFYLHKGEEQFSSRYGFVFISFAMYTMFLRKFLDLELLYPKVNKSLVVFERIVIPIGFLIFVLGIFSLQHFSIKIFAITYILSLPYFLFCIIYVGTRKRIINRIILFGTLIAILIARSTAISHFFSSDQNLQLINFQFIIAAVLVLFLALNLGLLYKSKLIVDQNIQLEVQRQSELNQQREMISADLHDDLGASLSSIHLNASMVQKTLHYDIVNAESALKNVVRDLKLVIENMGDIIWAINPDRKAHKSISGQLKDFYFDLMDGYGIQCNYHIDQALEAQITNIDARKNLLLIAKEAINNILKHAEATRIDVFFNEQNKMVLLEIQDNGIGMKETEKTFSGNGLQNMKNRTEKINGEFKIKSELGVGTTISCLVPFTNISYSHSMVG